jgi:hypothetical protein
MHATGGHINRAPPAHLSRRGHSGQALGESFKEPPEQCTRNGRCCSTGPGVNTVQTHGLGRGCQGSSVGCFERRSLDRTESSRRPRGMAASPPPILAAVVVAHRCKPLQSAAKWCKVVQLVVVKLATLIRRAGVGWRWCSWRGSSRSRWTTMRLEDPLMHAVYLLCFSEAPPEAPPLVALNAWYLQEGR